MAGSGRDAGGRDDVEWLTDRDDETDADDQVSSAPTRLTMTQWLYGIVALLVATGAVLVTRSTDGRTHSPTAGSTASSTSAPTTTPTSTTPRSVGDVLVQSGSYTAAAVPGAVPPSEIFTAALRNVTGHTLRLAGPIDVQLRTADTGTTVDDAEITDRPPSPSTSGRTVPSLTTIAPGQTVIVSGELSWDCEQLPNANEVAVEVQVVVPIAGYPDSGLYNLTSGAGTGTDLDWVRISRLACRLVR